MARQSIKYTWKVLSIKKKNTTNLDGVIIQATWKKTGVDKNGNDGVFLGSTPFELSTVDPDNFVSYSDLTEEIILGWIQSIVVEGYEEHVNKLIAEQIEEKASNAVEINSGFPWEPVGVSTSEPIDVETTEPVGVATTS